MKLVILGAGASYDAFKWYYDANLCRKWRPPLANEIFSGRETFRELYKKYPGALSASHSLSTQTDIEAYLQNQFEKAEEYNSVEIKKQLVNMRFFLQDLFFKISENLRNAGPSNLKLLIDLIYDYTLRTKEDVLIVSFNYDLLLEYELANLYGAYGGGFDISQYLHYKIKLIKPHGSCNWSTVFKKTMSFMQSNTVAGNLWTGNFTDTELIKHLENIYLTDSPNNDSVEYGGERVRRYKFPQIHIPMKGKDGFNMPKDQIDYLKDYLPKVDEILIVGWKGSEDHFNKTLQEHLVDRPIRIQVVNGYQKNGVMDSVFSNLKNHIKINDCNIFNNNIPAGTFGKLDTENLQFMEDNGVGSLTSFLLNIEKQQYKSIFCK
jgi:hypothetical protein